MPRDEREGFHVRRLIAVGERDPGSEQRRKQRSLLGVESCDELTNPVKQLSCSVVSRICS